MTEQELRSNSENRAALLAVLTTPIFRDALSIIVNKRRILEAGLEVNNLDGSERQSLRLFNQRLGMEDLIMQLHEFTNPPPDPDPGPPPSTFGKEVEFTKLQEYYDRQSGSPI